MSTIDTGGPAFPCHDSKQPSGMDLRDYFAAKAMQGILAGVQPIYKESDLMTVVAEVAYKQADAMLKARR